MFNSALMRLKMVGEFSLYEPFSIGAKNLSDCHMDFLSSYAS
jgi:hypothetical protein